jgi:hypothetical protein
MSIIVLKWLGILDYIAYPVVGEYKKLTYLNRWTRLFCPKKIGLSASGEYYIPTSAILDMTGDFKIVGGIMAVFRIYIRNANPDQRGVKISLNLREAKRRINHQ